MNNLSQGYELDTDLSNLEIAKIQLEEAIEWTTPLIGAILS